MERDEWVAQDIVRVGGGCECGLIKSAVKHIQGVGQLKVLYSVGRWSSVVSEVLQAVPHRDVC